jgi:hypothetical protein
LTFGERNNHSNKREITPKVKVARKNFSGRTPAIAVIVIKVY